MFAQKNYIDNNGNKQGEWVEEKHVEGLEVISKYKGVYYNSNKIGVWNLYSYKGYIIKSEYYLDSTQTNIAVYDFDEDGRVIKVGHFKAICCEDIIVINPVTFKEETEKGVRTKVKNGIWIEFIYEKNITINSTYIEDKLINSDTLTIRHW